MRASGSPGALLAPTNGPITGLVLAGGAGRRVDGADKPLLRYRGRPLIEWVLAGLRGQVDAVLISANRNLARYRAYGPVVTDSLPDHAGPLAGVLAALQAIDAGWLFVCAGDAPAVPDNLVARLREAVTAEAAHVDRHVRLAVLHDGAREQPLPFLVHASLRGHLETYVANGGRSVLGWQRAVPTHEQVCLPLPETDLFRSLNAPDDFDQSPICDCR